MSPGMSLFRLDRLRERSNVEVIAADVALERAAARAAVQAVPRLQYQLGNSRTFEFDYETCRGRPVMTIRLAEGRTVEVDLVSSATEVREAYDAWRAR